MARFTKWFGTWNENGSGLATAKANLMTLRVKREQYIASILVGDQVTTWQNFLAARAARTQERINKLNQPNP